MSLHIKILCILYNPSHNNGVNNNNSVLSQNRHSYVACSNSASRRLLSCHPPPPEYAAFSWRLDTHWKYLPFVCSRTWKKGCRNVLIMHLQLIILHFITSMFTVQLLNLVETIYTCLAFPLMCLRLSLYQPHIHLHKANV